MKDTKAVQQIAQEQREHIIDSGIVRTMRGQYIDVLLDGTKKLVREVILAKSITTIKVGWWVVIARIPRTSKWVALVALESITTGSTAISGDLTIPADVTATAKPYVIELSWSGSFRDVATYEVQHNSSASETGATMLKVEGSNFLYWCAPGTQRYFRVRAVSSSFERSGWSAWVNATSTTGSAYMFLGLNAAGTSPIWTAFNWTNVSGVAGAAMAHDHSTAAKGGQNLLSLVELGFNASTELTIAAGAVTRTQVFHRIDTQNDDPTDDLDTISGGADGKIIIIRPENDARTVVVKHNAGNIWLSGKADISLDDAGDTLILLYVNALTKWVDIGWSAVGAGGGGAPADAQYLVLALDGTLTDERRFVDGDGLQSVDGGAGGDYTLNIDVSDFAGAGLEDDGAENLRIAAAAAGDGLQGGGGDALAVDATVVRTSGNQSIGGVKTLTDNLILDDGVGDSPQIRLVGGSNDDTALLQLLNSAAAGQSRVAIRLPSALVQSKFEVQDSAESVLLSVGGTGNVNINFGSLAVNCENGAVPAGYFSMLTAETNTVQPVWQLRHNTSQTPLAGFGGRLLFMLKNSTTIDTEAASIDAAWDDPAAGSEDSRLQFRVRINGAAATEMCRVDGGGLVMAATKSIEMVTEVNEFSTDGTLAGNSDLAIPTEKAIKTYADARFPSGAIILWDNSDTCPTGYTRVSGADDRYLYAVASGAGGTGGATTHSHTLTSYGYPNLARGASILSDASGFLGVLATGAQTLPCYAPITTAEATSPALYKVLV